MLSFKRANRLATWSALFVGLVGLAAGSAVFIGPIAKNESGKTAALNKVILKLDKLHAYGPFINGHEKLACSSCHIAGDGTIRQQLQAIARNTLFDAEYKVDFGYKAVSSAECLSCHERPNERHPIHRFNEPRFLGALQEVEANSCLGCHSEHNGKTVNIDNIGYCISCHSDLIVKNDPVDVPHIKLIDNKNWDSCLGCHDFHGNHNRSIPVIYNSAFQVGIIRAYLDGGPSPYGISKSSIGLEK